MIVQFQIILDTGNMHLLHYDPNNTFKQSFLHYMIQEHDDEVELIEMSVHFLDQVNAQDCFGLTPVHYAVQFDLVNLLRFFLSNGGNTSLRDIYGDTAWEIATRYYKNNPKHEEIYKLFQKQAQKKRIRFKIILMTHLLSMYRQSVHNVWRPYGVGYYEAKNDFEMLQ
jgi:hypothetical protein